MTTLIVKTCRSCPFLGGGAVSRCNLRYWATISDSDNLCHPVKP